MTYAEDYSIPEEILEQICGAPRGVCLLVDESAAGKALTQRISYRVLSLRR